jgi:hypothetical protein
VREKLIMKSRQIVKKYDLKKEELEAQLDAALGDKAGQDVAAIYEGSVGNFETDTIHSGRIVDVINGDEIDVLLEAMEDESGSISSPSARPTASAAGSGSSPPRRGRRGQGHGHAQDQGRPAGRHRRARLPARQPGRHPPPGDIGEFIGQEIEAKILKIDDRRNIVISRRKLIEESAEA